MEEIYGEQNQRSYSVEVSWMFLSFWAISPRSAKASAGLVSALTNKERNSPGWPERFCATDKGTSTELSSASPVETIPVIVSGVLVPRPSSLATLSVLPILNSAGCLAASAAPTTHSAE